MVYYNIDKVFEKSCDDMIVFLEKMDIDFVLMMVYLKDGKVVFIYVVMDELVKLMNWMNKVSGEVLE